MLENNNFLDVFPIDKCEGKNDNIIVNKKEFKE